MNSGTSALLIQLGFVAWTGLLLWLARRLRLAGASAGRAAAGIIPLAWAWSALVLLNLAFARLQTYPLTPKVVALVASGAALFVLPVTCLPGRARTRGAVTLVVCACLVAFADVPYLRYFGNIVPVSAWPALPQVSRIRASVLRLLHPADLSLWLTLAGAVLFAARCDATRHVQPPRSLNALGLHGLIVGLCLAGSWPVASRLRHDFTESERGKPVRSETVFDETFVVYDLGVTNAHLFDWLRTARESWLAGRLTMEERRRVERFFAERRRHPPASGPLTGIAAGSNLILVQVESMQEWVVGTTVNSQEITPFLNRLRQESLYFPHVFDQTWGGRSSDAEFVVLNSLHALERGAVAFRRSRNHFVALPDILRRNGYATLSAHAYRRSFWNRAVLHPRYGFERTLFQEDLGTGEVMGWGLADAVFLQHAVPKLTALPRPFFAFLITLGFHHPFEGFPATHKQLAIGELEGTPVGNYLHSMHYIDAALGEFVEALQAAGLWQQTVLAVYGDHDSSLLMDPAMYRLIQSHCQPMGQAHPLWRSLQEQDPAGDRSHGVAIAALDTVPLFTVIPGHPAHDEVSTVGGQTDIGPTLLDLLGLGPPTSFLGRSLLTGDRSRAVVLRQLEGSVASQERLLLRTHSGRGETHCFAIPLLQHLPLSECKDLAQPAAEELAISQTVVLHDLATKISAALDGKTR